jgi:Ca2+-binding EF-hand superfamily protein
MANTLILEDSQLHPDLEKALRDVFDRFDVDKDGALNKEELDEFAKATNGEVFDKETLADIKENFEVNDKGWLTRDGFVDMYHLQTMADPEETWNDLKKHGMTEPLSHLTL